MKASVKEILSIIPDYEDLVVLTQEIKELSYLKMKFENKIKELESATFKDAMSKPLENGKFPSSSFVTNAYLHTGMNNETLGVREDLASVTSQLEQKKLLLYLYRDMMEMFRTVSANERTSNGF